MSSYTEDEQLQRSVDRALEAQWQWTLMAPFERGSKAEQIHLWAEAVALEHSRQWAVDFARACDIAAEREDADSE